MSYQSLHVEPKKRQSDHWTTLIEFETCYFYVLENSWQEGREMVTDNEMTATEIHRRRPGPNFSPRIRMDWKGSQYGFKRVAGIPSIVLFIAYFKIRIEN